MAPPKLQKATMGFPVDMLADMHRLADERATSVTEITRLAIRVLVRITDPEVDCVIRDRATGAETTIWMP
jgi:hypothetical protein